LGANEKNIPTVDDVYRTFGETYEAAQILETEFGNLLFESKVIEKKLLENPNKEQASILLDNINRKTLGQLLKNLKNSTASISELETLLSRALTERNRLAHSYYREHNLRINSEKGRSLMIKDLESIHKVILDAYKAVMLLSGYDLDKIVIDSIPTRHLPI
jgi:hypothetical protein